jgi:hypothetical protein
MNFTLTKPKVVFSISSLFLIALLSSCASPQLSAQDKRNNFDACTLEFIKKIDQSEYNNNPKYYDKQAAQGCSPLLTAETDEVEKFVAPNPSMAPKEEVASLDDFCALMKKAAFAHREFGRQFFKKADPNGYNNEKYYSRIRSYMRDGASLLRTLSGNYTSLIADAQDAVIDSYGFDGNWNGSEGRLYATCSITKDSVDKDFYNMMGW